MNNDSRRDFLKTSAAICAALAVSATATAARCAGNDNETGLRIPARA
ncbi:MAG: twin-arginine translocation signal domain-containing protein [Gammaproteobacteria bacterium]|nr:twin-arginine translocation signal domain-containing protein [Gammaproteobacteria bacterium]